MSKIGINDIVKAYHGSAEVSKIYLGTTVVYEAGGGAVPDYLCFTANQAGSKVGISNNGSNNPNVEYSTDGRTWSTMANNTPITLTNVEDKMYVRGNNVNGFSSSSYKYTKFTMTGQIAASGNIMSLVDTTDFENITTIPSNYCFYGLFINCTSLRSAEHLELPVTNLNKYYCYANMFQGCTSLTTAPALPAMSLAQNCYNYMFNRCTSLTTAPALPATTLADSCYSGMFNGCTSLTTAPSLPATTLANYCYQNMFKGCTSLTTAPELPATRLTQSCYNSMFRGCTSLTTAPSLPVTTLATSCYASMFANCTSLASAPALPATRLADSCYDGMFENTNVLPDCSNIDFTSIWVVETLGFKGLFRGTKVTDSDLNTILPHDANNHYCLPVTSVSYAGSYASMFENCTALTTAPELPATYVAQGVYSSMFAGCTSLTTAPSALPATSVSDNCYSAMFSGCTSLTAAPVLSATRLAQRCYQQMFSGCRSLTTAPSLPATTLAVNCYRDMFSGCSGLTTAPSLPATTLANWCYGGMFLGCTSLTTAPDLPATALTSGCYDSMFKNCTNLRYIKAMFTTTPSTSYTNNWVSGIETSGRFVMNSAATWSPDDYRGQAYGIPQNWVVEDENGKELSRPDWAD